MKKVLLMVAAVLAAAGIWFALTQCGVCGPKTSTNGDVVVRDGQEFLIYRNPTLDMEFEYRRSPNGYVVLGPIQSKERPEVNTLVVFNSAEYDELTNSKNDGREGPPTLTIHAVEVPPTTDLQNWIKTDTLSEYRTELGSLSPFTVDGQSAFRYRADGLYAADVTVTKSGDRIYMFYGAYLDANEPRRADYEEILKSVNFTTS